MRNNSETRIAVITGAARRIGAEIARHLHASGMNVIIHYGSSQQEAETLASQLNQQRPNSAFTVQQDLAAPAAGGLLAEKVLSISPRVDLLVNNASRFFPVQPESVSEQDWDQLVGSNFKAPYFLSCALASTLKQNEGCIINMADIYAEKPLTQHSLYCAAKAALVMTTKSLARDLAPQVRVNAIAPGPILWPEENSAMPAQDVIIDSTPLKRTGTAQEIAKAVCWLAIEGSFTTGQVLYIDGGRSLSFPGS